MSNFYLFFGGFALLLFHRYYYNKFFTWCVFWAGFTNKDPSWDEATPEECLIPRRHRDFWVKPCKPIQHSPARWIHASGQCFWTLALGGPQSFVFRSFFLLQRNWCKWLHNPHQRATECCRSTQKFSIRLSQVCGTGEAPNAGQEPWGTGLTWETLKYYLEQDFTEI